ncbi:DNA polymerase III subunit delta' [Viridibacillus arvi]|uniref:DNA polymerase III subunit delta' n=1 Tax=Viridibacillus arvi TaxID=263475 RepID=UPI0034CEB5D7
MKINLEKLTNTQPIVVQTLKNAFTKERVAHAYLFEGTKGTGKLDTAILFAKMYFCLNPNGVEPCYECNNCKRIDSGNHPDVIVVEPDGLSIKKEQIQALQKEFSFSGFESNKKIYIIKHADKMSTSAANSLLKFLEEPNPGTVALLVTEEVHRMLNTIISRCQLLSFNPLPHSLYVQQLINEGVAANDARLISSLTNNIYEGVEMYKDEKFKASKNLVINFSIEIQSGSLDAFIRIPEFLEHFKEKAEVEMGIDLITLFFKDLLYAKVGKREKIVFIDEENYFLNESSVLEPTMITSKIKSIMDAKKRIYSNVNPQLILEQIVIDIQK